MSKVYLLLSETEFTGNKSVYDSKRTVPQSVIHQPGALDVVYFHSAALHMLTCHFFQDLKLDFRHT